MSLRYHPEVDGLRAVAVLAVLAFHAVPAWCRGGFVGVDVFFVISGYLITGIIWGGLEAGTFTISGFYERRIRRIVPALAVVLGVVTPACLAILLPRDLESMGRSLAGTAASAANVVFWREAGYFGGASDTKPLLHAWSLAVEEQFYIAYPLLLILIHRYRRSRVTEILGALAAASLALGLWASVARPAGAFYLAPFRAWELLVGGLLSAGRVPPVASRAGREALGALGLLLVALSFVLVGERALFPVPGALPACLGTALLIHVSRSGAATACRVLSLRPMIGVGLISYSLYLWHWPLLALARYAFVPRATGGAVAACLLAAFVLSALTWRWVEQPARTSRRLSRRVVFASAAAIIAIFMAAGALFAATRGWPARFDPEVARLAAAADDVDPRRSSYLSDREHAIAPERAPTFGATGVAPATAVWGDSHGAALLPGIAEAARRHGQSVTFLGYSGMPPLVGVRVVGGEGALDGVRASEATLAYLERTPGLRTVVLCGRWARYVRGPVADFGVEVAGPGGPRPTLARADAPAGSPLDPEGALVDGLRATLARLRAAGKRVVLVGPVPEFGIEVPRALALVRARGGDPESFVLPASLFDERQDAILDALEAASGDGVELVRPDERLRVGDGYAATIAGRPLYHDDDHLGLAGAAYVSPIFDRIFERPRAG